MAKAQFSFILLLGSIGFLGACGGPSKEAKIATAVQTIVANALSANLEVVRTPSLGTGPFKCSGGGNFSFAGALSIDPSLNGAGGQTTLIYNNCAFKVCGDTVTLTGTSKSTLRIDVALNNSVTVQLTADDEVFAGVLEGTHSFAYKMTTSATTTSISDFSLQDNGNPLTVDGTEYSAANLNAFADGC